MEMFVSLSRIYSLRRMSYNLLKGKRGIVFGALNEQSIAWKVAEKAVEEGAVITLSNTPVAVRMGEISALAEKLNCEVIPADATSVEDLENVFKRSMEILGGKIDFVLHSIGMSPNVRKKRTYDDLDYDMLNKTLDISAVSFHKMIQSAKKLNAINEYGSIVDDYRRFGSERHGQTVRLCQPHVSAGQRFGRRMCRLLHRDVL